MKPFFLLRLQRAWRYIEPVIISVFNFFPKLINLSLFRALSKILHVRSVAAVGDYGTFHGSPLDLGVFGLYLMTGTYSSKLINLILECFEERKGGTFIDIGANIGFMTIPVAGAGIKCISLEPDPDNFCFLKQNVDEAGVMEKVTLHNFAAYDRSTELPFERSDWNHGDHRIRKMDGGSIGLFGEQHRQVISVKAVALDELLSIDDLPKPIVIKIDTEGAEVNVFRGGQKIISKSDLIIFEFCPYMIRRLGEDEGALIEFAQMHFNSGCILGNITKATK